MTHEEHLQAEESRLLAAVKAATDSDSIAKAERYQLLSSLYAQMYDIAREQAEHDHIQRKAEFRRAARAHQRRMASGAYIADDDEFWSCALSGVKGL